jgi:hypothetical protein
LNKTTICSVVFLDIVEYSKKSVAEQIKLKNSFNAFISHAIKNVPVNDRIILDTGDGAAISFLGDPEDALLSAMKLRDSVISEQDFFVRIGINLGPVRLVEDINKQPNIVGDGINVSQRIMNFAQPNQILVSRSFFDVISCVTDEYAKLFEYQGSRTDKHVREHEIYAVRNEVGQQEAIQASLKHAHSPAEIEKRAPWWADRKMLLRRIFPVAAAILIITAFAVKLSLEPARLPSPAQAPLPQSAPVAVSMPAAASTPVAPPSPAKPEKKHAARKRKEAVHHKKALPETTSTLVFRIMPWGEIYVDGKKRGVSPPLKELNLKSGKHEIEIRNTNLPSYAKTVETKPGESVIIEHNF